MSPRTYSQGRDYRPVVIFFVLLLAFGLPFVSGRGAEGSPSFAASEYRVFQKSIVDYRHRLNRRFNKVRRKKTNFIIVHTAEGGLQSTLKVVSRGKTVRGGRRTRGGHAHYVVARDGKVYRTLDKRYIADHAGLSMWDGRTDVNDVSIGIELVGYHYTEVTDAQYRSLAMLIDLLQEVYDLADTRVLTHSQVAYGKPNRWVRRNHRGRKRDGKNVDRSRAGLGPGPAADPDVKAGRLLPDRELAAIHYGKPTGRDLTGSNVITLANTAWNIAGEDYADPSTIYKLPNGKFIPGDQIGDRVGWSRIPKGTVVLLNQEMLPDPSVEEGPVKTIAHGLTAWTLAGSDYRKPTTIYFLPNGRVMNGGQISDWDDLPADTRLIVGYGGPFDVTRRTPPYKYAGSRYNSREIVYLFPDRSLRTGDAIQNFRGLPSGVIMFVPTERT